MSPQSIEICQPIIDNKDIDADDNAAHGCSCLVGLQSTSVCACFSIFSVWADEVSHIMHLFRTLCCLPSRELKNKLLSARSGTLIALWICLCFCCGEWKHNKFLIYINKWNKKTKSFNELAHQFFTRDATRTTIKRMKLTSNPYKNGSCCTQSKWELINEIASMRVFVFVFFFFAPLIAEFTVNFHKNTKRWKRLRQ